MLAAPATFRPTISKFRGGRQSNGTILYIYNIPWLAMRLHQLHCSDGCVSTEVYLASSLTIISLRLVLDRSARFHGVRPCGPISRDPGSGPRRSPGQIYIHGSLYISICKQVSRGYVASHLGNYVAGTDLNPTEIDWTTGPLHEIYFAHLRELDLMFKALDGSLPGRKVPFMYIAKPLNLTGHNRSPRVIPLASVVDAVENICSSLTASMNEGCCKP